MINKEDLPNNKDFYKSFKNWNELTVFFDFPVKIRLFGFKRSH